MAASEQGDPPISPDQPTRLTTDTGRAMAQQYLCLSQRDLQGMIQLPHYWSQRWSRCLITPVRIPIIDYTMTASSTCGSMIQYPHTILNSFSPSTLHSSQVIISLLKSADILL